MAYAPARKFAIGCVDGAGVAEADTEGATVGDAEEEGLVDPEGEADGVEEAEGDGLLLGFCIVV